VDIHRLYAPILRHFRAGRMKRFSELFHITAETRVLDLGGGPSNWLLVPVRPRLTIVNKDESMSKVAGAVPVIADACDTRLPSKSFDVVFSNSVIEHVGDRERQRQFAQECMRCGHGFFVQTPNRWFPVDPHTFLPFAHWLPKKIFNRLMWLSPRFLITRPGPLELPDFLNMRLLSKGDLQELFPGARIIQERFLGISKSLIAVSVLPCSDQKNT
jgi:SAM-dependent methyltransferase